QKAQASTRVRNPFAFAREGCQGYGSVPLDVRRPLPFLKSSGRLRRPSGAVRLNRCRSRRTPSERLSRCTLRSDLTEGAVDSAVHRVPAGHSVAPGGGPAPIPTAPRGPEKDPRESRRDDSAAAAPAFFAAVAVGVGPRGHPPARGDRPATSGRTAAAG